ncbi:HdeD family acid-resistance protein [Tropicimonas aquimaris]|uniref:HdeD family acid-resistance protein n=1 Tax=Tropicimonas aquimaris TaxID=914152 RepID=A0ABW3IWW8_9RHOB
MTNRILWIIMALLAIAGGIFALMNPFAASLAATTIAAWMFLIFGVLQVIAGFRVPGAGAKIWTLLMGALAIYLGITILGHPLRGMVTLTMMVGILFLAGGITKIILAFSLEDRRFFWAILLSGVVSVILAVMVFTNFPQSAAVVLGILLGVELLSDGVWSLAMALSSDGQEAES